MSGELVAAFLAGLAIATVTTPVGVSGAVFLLPVQLSLLHVANPAVTATNLLYNVVAGPGSLARHVRTGAVGGPLTRLLLAGTLPGVVLGSVLRVLVIPGARPFRVVAGLVLLTIGLWLLRRTLAAPLARPPLADRTVLALALAVGVLGGIYGIGGGSILAPLLVSSGLAIRVVAPAALASTFVTSLVGALTYVVLSRLHDGGSIAPDWPVGLACGVGGLVGGYVGARLQPHAPERLLRLVLAALATATGLLYLAQALG